MNIKLSELSKEEWYLEHFDGCPAFTEMTGGGFTSRLYNSKIPVYKINICYYGSGEGDWMSLVSDHKKIGQAIIQSFIKSEKTIVSLYKKWVKNFDFLMRRYYDLFKEDINDFSDEELINWAENIYVLYRKILLPGFIDGYMFYADKRFDFIIREYCEKNNISNPQKIFSILSAPVDPSFINEEEYELRKLVKLITKSGYQANNIKLKNFLNDKSNNNLIELIEKHLYKYSWIKSSYAGYKKYSWKDIDKEIKQIAWSLNSNATALFN